MPNVPAWLVALGAMIGYALSFWQNRITRKSNEDTVATAARNEIMETYRWAAELAAERDEPKRQLGTNTLLELSNRPDVTEADRLLILAALDVPLAPLESAWDTAEQTGTVVEPVVVDQDPPESERGDPV